MRGRDSRRNLSDVARDFWSEALESRAVTSLHSFTAVRASTRESADVVMTSFWKRRRGTRIRLQSERPKSAACPEFHRTRASARSDSFKVWPRLGLLFRRRPFLIGLLRDQPTDQIVARPEIWNVFITFEEPILSGAGQMHVTFEGHGLPTHEVKDLSSRAAVISISGQVPSGVLVIRMRY